LVTPRVTPRVTLKKELSLTDVKLISVFGQFSWPETQSVAFNEQNEPKCAQKYSSGQILPRKEKLRRNQVAIYYSNN
jgi:hypothetical protein